MNGYDVNQWNRAVAKAKELGLTLDIAAPNFRLYRSEAQLGVFATIDQLEYFLDGYDWGRQLLSCKEPGLFDDPKYLYWFSGQPLPASLPPGCEWYNRHTNKWNTEEMSPNRSGWTIVQRRWPKPLVEKVNPKPKAKAKKGKFVPTTDNPKRGIVFVERAEDSSCEGCRFDDPKGGCSMAEAECCPSCGRKDGKTGIFVREKTLKQKPVKKERKQ